MIFTTVSEVEIVIRDSSNFILILETNKNVINGNLPVP